MGEIRNCTREDIPAVAALFQKVFRDTARTAPASLASYIGDVFLDHPWFDPDVASRVHVNGDGVSGFVGVFPSRLLYRGKLVSAAITGSLMVADPQREPMAGAKLLRSVVKGPQHVTLSETANAISERLWQPLGGRILPLFSLDWVRPLKPAGAVLSLLTEKLPRAALLAPLAGVGDWLGAPLIRRYLRLPPLAGSIAVEANASAGDFVTAVARLSQSAAIRPAWSQADLEWFFAHAAQKHRFGPLRLAIVRSERGELVGCFAYHGTAGKSGRVLQLMAQPRAAATIVDALFHDADVSGLVSLRGRISPQFFDVLMTRQCVFVHRASTIIHTRDTELANAIASGDAMVTGLGGETWTRLIGDEFR